MALSLLGTVYTSLNVSRSLTTTPSDVSVTFNQTLPSGTLIVAAVVSASVASGWAVATGITGTGWNKPSVMNTGAVPNDMGVSALACVNEGGSTTTCTLKIASSSGSITTNVDIVIFAWIGASLTIAAYYGPISASGQTASHTFLTSYSANTGAYVARPSETARSVFGIHTWNAGVNPSPTFSGVWNASIYQRASGDATPLPRANWWWRASQLNGFPGLSTATAGANFGSTGTAFVGILFQVSEGPGTIQTSGAITVAGNATQDTRATPIYNIPSGAIAIDAAATITSAADYLPYRAATTIAADATLTVIGTVVPYGINTSYVASMDSGGTATADITPSATKRAVVRFPLLGEIPPLARITSVTLRGAITTPSADGVYTIRPYKFDNTADPNYIRNWNVAEPAGYEHTDPELDTFTTQYANAVLANAYATGITFTALGAFTIDLGTQAVKDIPYIIEATFGSLALSIVQTAGSNAAELNYLGLVIGYDVPMVDSRPLSEIVSVSILDNNIPPRNVYLDVAGYALRFTTRYQTIGDFTISIPVGDGASAGLVEMNLVHVRIKGHTVFTGVIETVKIARTPETTDQGYLIEASGRSLELFIANRLTGPFPGGLSFDETTNAVSIGDDNEVIAAGNVSVRGASFGAASTSAESIMLALAKTHTTAANAARRTKWTNNLSYAPDNRRGALGFNVSTRLQPLMSEIEKVLQRAIGGITVILDLKGRFRVYYLPGADRTTTRGTWAINTDTMNIPTVETEQSSEQLVTHVFVAASGAGSTRNLYVFKQVDGSDQLYDRREASIDAKNAASDDAAAQQAYAYLNVHSHIQTITASIDNMLNTGWLTAFDIGDKITVTDPVSGVYNQVRMFGIEVTIGTDHLIKAIYGADPVNENGYDTGNTVVGNATLITSPTPLPDQQSQTFKETSQSALS